MKQRAADRLTYSATGLPPGLDIDPVTGDITGTPTTPGKYSVTVTATGGSDRQLRRFLAHFWPRRIGW